MEQTAFDQSLVGALKRQPHAELDAHYPEWARRSHPVVKRHLGVYWKTIPPAPLPLLKLYGIQVALILATFILPFLFSVVMPLITISVVMVPLGGIMYAQTLFAISTMSVDLTQKERRQQTFDVLRTTPIPLREVLLSKIAAAIWRQMENLGMLLQIALIVSLPIIIMQYTSIWPIDEYPLLARFGIISAIGVSVVRLILEPVMVGAFGTLVGAFVNSRIPAVGAAAALTGFYFLLINLPRLIDMAWYTRIMLESVLPIVLPLVLTIGALRLAEGLIASD